MKRYLFATLGIALVASGLPVVGPAGQARAERPAPASPPSVSAEALNVALSDYCITCHSDMARAGNMSLESFDVAQAEQQAELAEKMIRKLRAGMMPPSYAMQPEDEIKQALTLSLETQIDEAAAENPRPGRRSFQRLNQAEYARSVRDLLAIDVDVSAFLPPDTMSHSFDNIADVQTMSATLMEGYMRAADTISRAAIGEPNADAREATYPIPRRESQMDHVEGTPFGTRGGTAVIHNFPADGEYIFKIQFHGTPTGFLYGNTVKGEKLEISINGERVALLDVDAYITESSENGLNIETERISVRAGPQRVAVAFLERFNGPVDDLLAPIEHTLADTTIGRAYGVTTLPHLRLFSINGPHHVTGVSDTPSRRKIFSCRPVTADDEAGCATEIISRLAGEAYRRPVSDSDVEGLLSFYQAGADKGDFESGIRTAVQAILTNPQFVFRLEHLPDDAVPGESYRISDIDLASRLSFFLWATGPDEELMTLAVKGELSHPQMLDQQVERMLKDPRSEALATRFASQWLRLQDLEKLHPDYLLYPQYDTKLSEALKRETELFVDYLIHEDRPVLELLTGDYTFVNERIAMHYGIPNVVGNDFRLVQLQGERKGLLGQGSILTLTSIANRTSPVQRGKWILEVLLGSPPPPPPPNVPDLEATQDAAEGRVLSVREAMEQHRANPACQSCHRVIDPLGLALENFDVTGAWRIKDNGVPIDASGELYDGSKLDGPEGLRRALLKYSDAFIMSFTESLMTYGLGRRVEYHDMPAIRRIVREAEEKDNRLSAFIHGVVQSTPFQMAEAEADVVTTELP